MSNKSALTSSWADAAEDDDFTVAPGLFSPQSASGAADETAPTGNQRDSPRGSRSPPRRRRSRSRSPPPRRRRSRSRSPPGGGRGRGGGGGGGRQRAPPVIPSEPPFSLFCGSLAFSATEDDLREFFSEAGEIAAVRLIADRDSDRHKGFGYVEFATADGLRAALERDGQQLQGRALRLDVATPKPRQQQQQQGSWSKPRHTNKERPKLNLAPRSTTGGGGAAAPAPRSGGSNPFGDARPRDEVAVQAAKEAERQKRQQQPAPQTDGGAGWRNVGGKGAPKKAQSKKGKPTKGKE